MSFIYDSDLSLRNSTIVNKTHALQPNLSVPNTSRARECVGGPNRGNINFIRRKCEYHVCIFERNLRNVNATTTTDFAHTSRSCQFASISICHSFRFTTSRRTPTTASSMPSSTCRRGRRARGSTASCSTRTARRRSPPSSRWSTRASRTPRSPPRNPGTEVIAVAEP